MMFRFTSGKSKISTTCRTKTKPRFTAQSHTQLKDAVEKCLQLSSVGDCAAGIHGPIREWDVSPVTDMHSIFAHTHAFNKDIGKWDVSAVTDMTGMFSSTAVCNSDISKWDVSAVTRMNGMFYEAVAFNADISRWDVSSVVTMNGMFYQAGAFNVNISKWDVSAVLDMSSMFIRSRSFNQVPCIDLWDWGVREIRGNDKRKRDQFARILGALRRSLDQFKSKR